MKKHLNADAFDQKFISFLRTGVPLKELCRKHGFSQMSYYLCHNTSGGKRISAARRLKLAEAENATLKKLLAEAMLHIEGARETLRRRRGRS